MNKNKRGVNKMKRDEKYKQIIIIKKFSK